ncbi:hypothetical protein EVAR_4515_1 [Eumeta japonica]|uniref:Uncharacterized protein n=1 Tax=Eumeta variegata TaxID=151549 RepID=A0A4C1SWP6_EUMVA|nr:hypothetical protein EVAR_4515_1 [Eumeta japonica]
MQHVNARRVQATNKTPVSLSLSIACCARGRPIIVEWERDARHSAGLSLVRDNRSIVQRKKLCRCEVRHESVATALIRNAAEKGMVGVRNTCAVHHSQPIQSGSFVRCTVETSRGRSKRL